MTQPNKKITKKNRDKAPSTSLTTRINTYLEKYEWRSFWVIFAITLLFSALLYDPRVSPSGDDSGYILRAYNFYKNFSFPLYQGPLYPIALSLFTAIFGLSLLPLKLFSMASILASIYIFFKSLRNRISYLLLFCVLFLLSINAYLLFYASQTYSEAFYILMQALVLLTFFTYFIDNKTENHTLKFDIKRHSILALALLGAVLTRTVGFSLFFAVIAYFIVYRQWKNLSWSIAFFVAFYAGFELIKFLIWDIDLQFSGQSSQLFNKNFYEPQQGKENLLGLFNRFIQNSNLYLSKNFYVILGLRKDINTANLSVDTLPLLTCITYLAASISLFLSFRHNKYIFFSTLAAGSFLMVTFFSLQTIWDQERLIIPAVPLLLLSILYLVYYVSNLQNTKARYLKPLFYIVIVLLTIPSLLLTVKKIEEARQLKNEFSGLTPDWINYLRVSQWSAENLPKESLVACRKPDISSIYAKGKKFYGITNVPSNNANLFIEKWKSNPSYYVALSVKTFDNKPFLAEFNNLLMQNQQAVLYINNSPYFVFRRFDSYQQHANNMQITETNCLAQIDSIAQQGSLSISVFYPDSLLYKLKQADVTHVITASLRSNPYVKNGYTINTVERYLNIIQTKYPTIFKLIITSGSNDNEPASIYEIDWNQISK